MTDRAQRAPHLIDRMRAEGHRVELHCRRHVRHSEMDESALRADTVQGLHTLAQLGTRASHWRPPWGVVTPTTRRVAEEHGLRLVGWSVEPEDWGGEPAPLLHERVADQLVAGAVVLLHDGIGPGARRSDCRQTVELIPRLLETFRHRGLRPAPASEVAA